MQLTMSRKCLGIVRVINARCGVAVMGAATHRAVVAAGDFDAGGAGMIREARAVPTPS